MEPQPPPQRNSNRFLKGLAVMVGAAAAIIVLGGYGVYSCLRISEETRVIRDSLLNGAGDNTWKELVELRAGPLIFGLGRSGLWFADLEPEVRAMVQAVRGLEVGIYTRASDGDSDIPLDRADLEMNRRGWERVVTVKTRDEHVLIYARAERTAADVAVVVQRGADLILVSGTAKVRPLLELLANANGKLLDGLPPRTHQRDS